MFHKFFLVFGNFLKKWLFTLISIKYVKFQLHSHTLRLSQNVEALLKLLL